MQPPSDTSGARGGPGEGTLWPSPRRLYAAFDARKRPYAQASLRDCVQSLSLVALGATYVSTRESGLPFIPPTSQTKNLWQRKRFRQEKSSGPPKSIA